jgi:hypothetical protein
MLWMRTFEQTDDTEDVGGLTYRRTGEDGRDDVGATRLAADC